MSYSQYSDFSYWFSKCTEEGWWNVFEKDSHNLGTHVDVKINSFNEIQNLENLSELNSILEDWNKFKTRPEYMLGQAVAVNGVDADDVITEYSQLLKSIMMVRSQRLGQDPDSNQDYIQKVLDWVESTDFYDAPASTRFHESFKHGLLYHTLTVYNNMLELIKLQKFKDVHLDSIALCCLVHDWCKIGLYESYKRNVKNETTGQWEAVDSFRVRGIDHPFGHGVTSMFMANKMFKLTEEEALAIRWHMGMFNVADNEVNDFQESCERYPMVLLLQFADHLSITNY